MFGDATARYRRARNWAIGSDPGLLRLRMAIRTTGALGTSLLVLFLLTKATGQPLTVALLGAVITMISARSVNEPDPRQQRITMALLPLPTALAITAASLVSPHPVDRRRPVRRGGVPRGLRAPVRSARNGAGHGHLHVVLLLAVPAGQIRRAAVADRLDDRGHAVQLPVECLHLARPAGKCSAREHSVIAGADGDRRGHHCRHRPARQPRRAATASPANPGPPAQRDRAGGPGADRRPGQSECAVARRQRRRPRAVVVRRRTHRRTPRNRGGPRGPVRPARRHTRRIGRHPRACWRARSGHRTPTPCGRPRTSLSGSSNGIPTTCRCGDSRWPSSTRPRPPPRSASGSSGSRPKRRDPTPRRRARQHHGRACCPLPGRPFRWPSPPRWPSSSARPSHRRTGTGQRSPHS